LCKIAALGGLEMRANTHMGMTFSHFLPGTAGFAATVFTPWDSVDSGVMRNAVLILLGVIILAAAIAVFRRSIKQKTKEVPKQSLSTESQILQTLELAIEKGRAGIDPDIAASPATQAEIPSPPAKLAPPFDKALPELKAEHGQIAQSAFTQSAHNGANGTNHNGIAHPPANPAHPETAHVSLPRLSELRGMRFSQALRELDKTKRSTPANAGPVSLSGSPNGALADRQNDMTNGALNDPINEILMSAIAPFEPMFAPLASASPAKSTSHREEDRRRSPREPKAPGKETNSVLDQLHILPSRRGQYKKKA
jgi:hypothetical protein